jgi:cell division inhibitor SepF
VSSNGLWHRTLIYLGLKEEPEEGYDELPERFDPADDPHAEHAPPRRPAASRPAPRPRDEEATVRPLRGGDVHVRAVPNAPVAARRWSRSAGSTRSSRSVPATAPGRPSCSTCSRAGADARRVVDFVSGLTYVTRGQLTKVGTRAFLLVPDGVHLPAEERRRLGDLGYRLPSRSEG